MALSHEEIWRRYDAIEARLSAPLSERMLDLAGVHQGTRLLDLATGRGEPAIPAAHRGAKVTGVELAPGLLQMARERAEKEGVALELCAGDAHQLPVSGPFDALTCRWALMYLRDPVQALVEARRVATPQARLVAALWAEPERVDWFSLPRQALNAPPVDFTAPGVFRLAQPEVIARDFAAAGWNVEATEERYVPVMESSDPRELVEWAYLFIARKLLPDAAAQLRWERDFTAELGARRQLGGITRLVVATPFSPR
jgi:SAM-dependent methyltransferase